MEQELTQFFMVVLVIVFASKAAIVTTPSNSVEGIGVRVVENTYTPSNGYGMPHVHLPQI
jgi:hypothetical protein